ncbi:Uu.00g129140.m01.CDS01 [Anthostomella pinea]|uniref:Uu.00g129140.m01.CDS01 n=1 Tax=Anthostomella pinea TaxID=933095 RepID=A0AAI8YHY3_9PEZI|nr:Uu.00g129140.m01.CDS01 [Anthostomella pinea]
MPAALSNKTITFGKGQETTATELLTLFGQIEPDMDARDVDIEKHTHTALMRTCKAIYKEATSSLYLANHIIIDRPFLTLWTDIVFHNLKHITTMILWIGQFEQRGYDWEMLIHQLCALPLDSLKSIQVYFQRPNHYPDAEEWFTGEGRGMLQAMEAMAKIRTVKTGIMSSLLHCGI